MSKVSLISVGVEFGRRNGHKQLVIYSYIVLRVYQILVTLEVRCVKPVGNGAALKICPQVKFKKLFLKKLTGERKF